MSRNRLISKSDIKYIKENYDLIIGALGLAGIILSVLNYGIGYIILGVPLSLIAIFIRTYRLYNIYLNNKKIERSKLKYDFKKIDKMNGYQFERFVATGLKTIGFNTGVTKSSGDFGIDVIAKKKDKVIGIQVKHYNIKVGYDAVKEAYSGGDYWNCNEYWVITSSNKGFTKQAIEGAKKLNIKLYNIDDFALILEEGVPLID